MALVMALLFAPAGWILGASARRQIRKTGESGWELATAGMWIGMMFTVVPAAFILIYIGVVVIFFPDAGSTG